MGLGHNGTGTQWDWCTVGLGHNGSSVQWDWDTVGLVHSGTGTQWVWCTVGLGHNGSSAQWDWDSMGLVHSGTGTQWGWNRVGRSRSSDVCKLWCETVTGYTPDPLCNCLCCVCFLLFLFSFFLSCIRFLSIGLFSVWAPLWSLFWLVGLPLAISRVSRIRNLIVLHIGLPISWVQSTPKRCISAQLSVDSILSDRTRYPRRQRSAYRPFLTWPAARSVTGRRQLSDELSARTKRW